MMCRLLLRTLAPLLARAVAILYGAPLRALRPIHPLQRFVRIRPMGSVTITI